jgi:hypothetical protein
MWDKTQQVAKVIPIGHLTMAPKPRYVTCTHVVMCHFYTDEEKVNTAN